MSIDRFLHLNIRTADVEATREFYERALGFTAGERPAFESKGYWLYLGAQPIVHIVQRKPSEVVHEAAGNLDHAAFHGKDINAMRSRLESAGITFREAQSPVTGSQQIFVNDPNGIKIEIEFDDHA